jgi:carbonic anhydrase
MTSLLFGFLSLTTPAVMPDPMQTLRILREGNHRFASGYPEHPRQSAEDRRRLALKQAPHTVVITCSDSRVVPEMLFDQGLGDLFVVRVAGNTVGDRELGSVEYALEHLGARLVMVLGHTKCGAVKAAVESQGHLAGALNSIVDPIRPSVSRSQYQTGDRLTNAVKQNVRAVVHYLSNADAVMRSELRERHVRVVGGVYDLESGTVKILSDAAAEPKRK